MGAQGTPLAVKLASATVIMERPQVIRQRWYDLQVVRLHASMVQAGLCPCPNLAMLP